MVDFECSGKAFSKITLTYIWPVRPSCGIGFGFDLNVLYIGGKNVNISNGQGDGADLKGTERLALTIPTKKCHKITNLLDRKGRRQSKKEPRLNDGDVRAQTELSPLPGPKQPT